MTGLIVDLFAGGGGASTGIEAALGRPIDIAVNHSPTAIAVHTANHPNTQHFTSDVFEVDPNTATRGRPVDVLWASPDCTHFSRAKSGVPRSKNVRSLAHVVVEWARAVRPNVIFVENVAEFATWGPLDAHGHPIKERAGETFCYWRASLELLGYSVETRVLDSSQFAAPTKRKRLFVVARCDGRPIVWPAPTHGGGLLPCRTAASCMDWSLPIPSIFERPRPLAEKTLARIAEGIRRYVLGSPSPFFVRDAAVGAPRSGRAALVAAFLAKHYTGVVGQTLEAATGTITAKDHHALTAIALAKFRGTGPSQPMSCDPCAPLPTISAGGIHVAAVAAFLSRFGVEPTVSIEGVRYGIADIGMRMLEPHELLRAQFGRFAAGYDLSAAQTKAAQVRLIGNSVCPEVAEALVAANVRARRAVAA